jgi:hypothetical protein
MQHNLLEQGVPVRKCTTARELPPPIVRRAGWARRPDGTHHMFMSGVVPELEVYALSLVQQWIAANPLAFWAWVDKVESARCSAFNRHQGAIERRNLS